MTLFLIVLSIAVFCIILIYTAFCMFAPAPPNTPKWLMYMLIPFAYINMIIYIIAVRDWKAFRDIGKWKF